MNKPITGIDFLGAGNFYPKVNDETTMKLGELGWPNSSIDKANQPQRKPLTDEEIVKIWESRPYFNDFARAIEAAHGIKE